MPNTLAHIGIQALATRTLIRTPDPKWIYLGCVIPDIPWIIQRGISFLIPGIDFYELRLYAIAQASLAVSMLVCGAFSLVSDAPRRIFAVLALNAFLHLLLDALQTKWGNGVHLLAPVSWEIWNVGLFWPESTATLLLTVLGLGYFGWAVWRRNEASVGLCWPSPARLSLAALLLGAYFALPWALRGGPESTDSHSVRTLRSGMERAGSAIAVDRGWYERDEGGDRLRLFTGEELDVVGHTPPNSAVISARGHFSDPDTLVVDEFHVHSARLRMMSSYVGLAVIAAVWMLPAIRIRPRSPH